MISVKQGRSIPERNGFGGNGFALRNGNGFQEETERLFGNGAETKNAETERNGNIKQDSSTGTERTGSHLTTQNTGTDQNGFFPKRIETDFSRNGSERICPGTDRNGFVLERIETDLSKAGKTEDRIETVFLGPTHQETDRNGFFRSGQI